jgi:nucleoside-diphosphate-sugar epimerase
MFQALFDTPVVILRPSFAYGPGQERTKLVPHVITKLLAGESPELSSGERVLDLVYAPDVAEAYLAAAVAEGVDGATFDIGIGRLTSVREVVETIVGLLGPTVGAPAFGRVRVRPLEQEIDVDPEIAAAGLGWRARTSLVDGLRQTIDWYRGNAGAQTAPATTR